MKKKLYYKKKWYYIDILDNCIFFKYKNTNRLKIKMLQKHTIYLYMYSKDLIKST